jgi:DNA-binding NtrC family response regulator
MNLVIYKNGIELDAISNIFNRQKIASIYISDFQQMEELVLDEIEINCIIIDYETTKKRNINILKKMKVSNPNLKVIVIVSFTDDKVLRRLADACIDKIIIKPFSMHDLLPHISKHKEIKC